MYSCRQIKRQSGWRGYAIGLNLSLILSFTGIVQMFVYEGTKKIYDYLPIPQSVLSERNFLCGALCKLITVLLSYPITTVRTRAQQNQYVKDEKTKKYSGDMEIIRRTYRDEGLLGFFKGFQINIFRGMLQKGIYFYSY